MTKIHDFIYSHEGEIKKLLGELVAIPSVMGKSSDNAPFGEEPKNALLHMEKVCREMGFSVTNYENAVLCVDYAPNAAPIELGILAHLDVVPAEGAGWKTNPFELSEKDGILYGRGVIDDKGPAVAALYALLCIKELGVPLKTGVRLIFGTNEENGSEDLEIYKKHDIFPKNVFTPDGSFPVINIEKGMIRGRFSADFSDSNIISIDGGTVINAVPDCASAVLQVSREALTKAISRDISDASGVQFTVEQENDNFLVTATGKAAHASTPEGGKNALTALISLINRLTGSDILRGIEKLFPFGETDGNSLGLKCSDESGALTCVFSKFALSQGSAVGQFDIRFPTCTTLSEVKEKCQKAFSENGFSFETTLEDEPHVVPENSDFVQKLLSVYEKIEGERGYCVAIGGGTYVHNIEGGVAFGAERGDTDYHMHGDNEFVTAEELLKDAVLFAEVIAEVCG